MPDTYDHDALGTLAARGVTQLEFWCVGRDERGRQCTNRHTVALAELIASHGPATTMVMLARRTRCTTCGHLGAHVQPARPPASGMPGYGEWLDGELSRAAALLREHGRL